jgi:hypothetical protein
MTHRPPLLRPLSLLSMIVTTATAIASCGGSGGVVGSGGTGRSDSGQAVGTVNGFGSVIVDGDTYEALNASVVSEIAPSVDAPAEVKLGQRVSIAYEMQGVARTVRVETTLAGPVTSTSASGFTSLGQTITVNTATGAGPLTQFGGGYAQPSDIKPGDSVEVHGVLVQGSPLYSIQATRVEKLAAAPGYLRVTGLVATLSQTAAVTFSLAGLTVDATSAVVLPAGSGLAAGETVVVLAPMASLGVSASGKPTLRAAQVRVVTLENRGLDDDVSGSVASLDTQAKTFLLGSLVVNYATATMMPASSTLANRQYVKVHGTIASDGTLVAVSVTIREGDPDNQSTLRGNISALDSVALRLTVRGVVVDFSGATISGCPATGLANGLFVEVDGMLTGSDVIAKTVQCQAESSGSTVERDGVATAVDVTTTSFTLLPEHGSGIAVQWSASTFFGGLTPQTLSGKSVEIEGALVNGVLIASTIKADD